MKEAQFVVAEEVTEVQKSLDGSFPRTRKRLEAHTIAIERVMFNGGCTIVFWTDGTKTVVKCDKREEFDMEKGLMAAIIKRLYGCPSQNTSGYNALFREFCVESNIETNKKSKKEQVISNMIV